MTDERWHDLVAMVKEKVEMEEKNKENIHETNGGDYIE